MTAGTAARPWYESFASVTARIRCGDEVHRLTWRRGRLIVEDHNVTAERSLRALGGSACPCLVLLNAWSEEGGRSPELLRPGATTQGISALFAALACDQDDDEEVTTVKRSEDDVAASVAQSGLPPRVAQRVLRHVMQAQREAIVRALAAALAHRRSLGVVMGWARRWDDIPPEVRLQVSDAFGALVADAVGAGMRRWRRALPDVRPSIETVVAPAAKRAFAGWIDPFSASAKVTLPLSWLVTVWARGCALVDGCFVLDAVETADGVQAEAVRWERLGPATSEPVTVAARLWRDGEGGWLLRWA